MFALRDVSLQLDAGMVLAVVGANGAGKSTLIKILTGYFDRYEGSVAIDGQPVRLNRPDVARAAGIHAVYQEVDACIAPHLSVTDNLLLDQLVDRRLPIILSERDMERNARRIAARVELSVPLTCRAGELSLHQKQLLLIARALEQSVRFLVLDEPTAALSVRETERLLATVRDLRQRGIGVLYVSHRLREITDVADQVVVLRNGRLFARFGARADPADLAAAVVGEASPEVVQPGTSAPAGEVVLEVEGLFAAGRVRGVSLVARRKEILGITGLVGAGKSELLRAIFGADPMDGGRIRMGAETLVLHSPQDAVARGIYLIPEERRAQGLFMDFSALENITCVFLHRVCRHGVIHREKEQRSAHAIATSIHLRGNPDAPVATLSGGNQQKVVIGKWLMGAPRVLLMDEPTQGVDVGTRGEIYRRVRDLAQETAVVYASSDIDEVVGLCDRILVMVGGRIAGEFPGATADRQALVALASGLPGDRTT